MAKKETRPDQSPPLDHLRDACDEIISRSGFRLTRAQLAEKANVSPSSISQFLKNGRRLSSLNERRLTDAIREIQEEHQETDFEFRLPVPRLSIEELAIKYKELLRNHVNCIDIRAVVARFVRIRPLQVQQLFVCPRFKSVESDKTYKDFSTVIREAKKSKKRKSQEARPVHVLGPAGCGKSMLVRRNIERTLQFHDEGKTNRLPILIPLSILNQSEAEAKLVDPDESTLIEIAMEWYRVEHGFEFGALFDKLLSDGEAIVILDGLDEVRSDRRENAGAAIKFLTQAHQLSGNRFTVTEREPHPFTKFLPIKNALTVSIEPFDGKQRRELQGNWTKAFGVKSLKEQEKIEELDELESNPLFISLSIALRLISDRQPRQCTRAAVLLSLFESLLGSWRASRSLAGNVTYLPEGDWLRNSSQEMLGELALAMFKPEETEGPFRVRSRLSYDKAIRLIREKSEIRWGKGVVSTSEIETFIEDGIRAGLLARTDRDQGDVRFAINAEYMRDWIFASIMVEDRGDFFEQNLARYQSDPAMCFDLKRPLSMTLESLAAQRSGNALAHRIRQCISGSVSEWHQDGMAIKKPASAPEFTGDPSEHDNDYDVSLLVNKYLHLGLDLCMAAYANQKDPAILHQIQDPLQSIYENTDHLSSFLLVDSYLQLVRSGKKAKKLLPDDSEEAGFYAPNLDAERIQQLLDRAKNRGREDYHILVDKLWRNLFSPDLFELLIDDVEGQISEFKNDAIERNRLCVLLRRINVGIDSHVENKTDVSRLKKKSKNQLKQKPGSLLAYYRAIFVGASNRDTLSKGYQKAAAKAANENTPAGALEALVSKVSSGFEPDLIRDHKRAWLKNPVDRFDKDWKEGLVKECVNRMAKDESCSTSAVLLGQLLRDHPRQQLSSGGKMGYAIKALLSLAEKPEFHQDKAIIPYDAASWALYHIFVGTDGWKQLGL